MNANDDQDRATVGEFLSLPAEAMPSARFASPDPGDQSERPWWALRRWYCAGIIPDAPIRIRADRDGWRGGIVVCQEREGER